MTDTTTTPEDELAALEQAAIDGEPVTPEQLTLAREKVTLAGLFRKGQAARAEEKARREAEDAREDAKKRVSAMFAGDHDPDALIAEREAAVVAAIRALAEAVDARNAVIREAAAVLSSTGVPRPAAWGQTNPLDVPGLDDRFYAWVDQGEELRFVRENGNDHFPSTIAGPMGRVRGALQAENIRAGVEL